MSRDKDLKEQYELISEKIGHLQKEKIIETQPDERFRLEKRIAEAEADRKLIEQQLVDAEKQISICPYRGLFPFREQDVGFFFGREIFTEKLVEAVQDTPIVSVIGPSGSGKSSVVFAGLMPYLRKQGNWVIASFSPGVNPFQNLADALEELLKDRKAGRYEFEKDAALLLKPQDSKPDTFVDVKEKIQLLRQGEPLLQEIVELLGAQTSRLHVPQAPHLRLLIFADQFEELYTLCRDKDLRQQFLRELLSRDRIETQQQPPNFNLVITLRADFLSKALSEPYLSSVLKDSSTDIVQNYSTKLHLGSMDLQELKAVIEKPVEKVGITIEEGLTESILDAIAKEPGNLPLLEFTLTSLWIKRTENVLTTYAYKEIGGVEKALARYAEERYHELTPEEQERVQRLFVQLVQPGEGTEDTRRAATRSELGEENWNFVTTKLTASRLVVAAGSESTGGTVTLVHEALIREWQRLQDWMEIDREFRTWQERLRAAMREWERNNRDEGALLRGAVLVEAEHWLETRRIDLSGLEQEYIKKSRKRLLEEEERWKTLYEEAEEQRKKAEIKAIEALNQSSRVLFLSHDELGALLTVVKAGKHLKHSSVPAILRQEIVSNLREFVYNVCEKNRLQGHTSIVCCVVFNPDGSMLASASFDGTIKLWNVVDGRESTTLHGHSGTVRTINFSPDGSMLVSGSSDRTIKLWDLAGKQEIATLPGHSGAVNSVTFSPDASILASGSSDSTIKLWDLARRKEMATLLGHSDSVRDITFSPDGAILASGSSDKTIKFWNIANSHEIITLQGHANRVQSVRFNPDGSMLASGSNDGRIKLWNVADGHEISTLQGHSNPVRSVVFSPEGTMLASGSYDNTIKLWNIADSKEISTFHEPDKIRSIDFSPDGTILASGNWDSTIRFRDLTGTPEIITLHGHSGPIRSIHFSPDGTMLASGSTDNTAKLWNVTNRHEMMTLSGHSDNIKCVDFSPDGKRLASGSNDNTIKLWDLINKREIVTLHGHSNFIGSIHFSPDNKMLASGSKDKTIKLWNISDGSLITTLHGHSHSVRSVKFSPNSKILAGSDGKTIKLWDIETYKKITTLSGHSDEVTSVSFSPDGQILASLSKDNTIKLWSITDRREITTLYGHSDSLYNLSLSSDGTMLASSGFDSIIKLWNLLDRSKITQLYDPGFVFCIDFSPDGTKLASGSGDNTIKLWDLSKLCNLDIDDLLARGCRWLQGYLKTNPNVSEEDRCLCDDILKDDKD